MMLRKDHLMDTVMTDSDPDSYKNTSFFSIPNLFIGFNTKPSSDGDFVKSPTSTLDFRVFSNISNPFSFRTPKSLPSSTSPSGFSKLWNFDKVGLGIVNSMSDEPKPSFEIPNSSKSRNIIFGPQFKINIPNSLTYDYESFDCSMKTNSPVNSPISNVVFSIGEATLQPEELGKNSSSSSISSPQNCVSSSKSLAKSPSVLSDSFGDHSHSLPALIGSLCADEIELSEDYTCIVSHGPNPKIIHIFGDCVLECHNEVVNGSIELPRTSSKCPEGLTPYPSDEFLRFCYSCKKELEEGIDIYMYRGEKAFCSFECRFEEILVEEEMEKSPSEISKSYHDDLFDVAMPSSK